MDTPSATPTPTSAPSPTPPSGGSGKKLLLILLAVLAGLALLSVIGGWIAAKAVGFGLKKALEAGGVQIDERGGAVTLGGKDGTSMRISDDGTLTFTDNRGNTATVRTEEGKLPADFSTAFPVHGSLSAVGGAVTRTPKGDLNTATWKSTATVAELDAWYRRELPAKGWTIGQAFGGTSAEGSIMSFTRGDGDDEEGGQMTIQVDDGTVYVHVLFTASR